VFDRHVPWEVAIETSILRNICSVSVQLTPVVAFACREDFSPKQLNQINFFHSNLAHINHMKEVSP